MVDPVDIPRIAKAGIIASMQPTHQTSDRTMAEARLDPPRLKAPMRGRRLPRPARGLRSARISRSNCPTPSPASPPRSAARTRRATARRLAARGERDLRQALAGFTRGAAYAGFAEDRLGTLEPGKWADFILVDRDISSASPTELAATQVLETWVAGKRVWQRPLARLPGAGNKHPRGENCGSSSGGLPGSIPQIERHPGAAAAVQEAGDRRVAVGPVAGEHAHARSRNASRTASRSIAAASLALHVRHQSAVK